MPTIAFWNLARKKHLGALVEMIEDNGIEILVVAEQAFQSTELILAYAYKTGRSLYDLNNLNRRVRLYSIFPENRFRSIADDAHLSIKEYKPLIGLSVLIVGVHLLSKLHQRDMDQAAGARRVAARIEEAEQHVGHNRTLVLGDFNMDPFDTGMVDSDGLHGVMDRRIAEKTSRQVGGQDRRFFYNPMWKLMGDHSSRALGTYYRGAGSFISYFWHTFDQVLLRPSLLAAFREEELRMVDTIGTASLLARRGPGIETKISDHLPILLKLHT